MRKHNPKNERIKRRYLAYLENCHELVADPAFPALHAKICADKIGQDVPPLRAIEWIMYGAPSHQGVTRP